MTEARQVDGETTSTLNRMAHLAARALRTPVALVSLLDDLHQIYRGQVGLPSTLIEERRTPVGESLCQHVVTSGEPVIINDIHATDLGQGSAVSAELQVVAYLGVPIVFAEHVIGTVCVIDAQARSWTPDDLAILRDLAEMATTELRLRVDRLELNRQRALADDLQAQFDAARQVGSIGTWTLDLRKNQVHADANLARLFGLSDDEATRDVLSVFIAAIHPEDRERVTAEINDAIRRRGGYACEYRVLAADRQYHWVEARGRIVLDDSGTPISFPGVLVDITSRKEAELLRRQADDLRLMVFESVRELAIFTTDVHGTITTWNEGAQHVFGYEPREAIGQSAALLFTPEDQAAGVPAQELATAARTGRATADRWHLRQDHQRFFANGLVTPLIDEGSVIIGFTKVARDVTATRADQEKIRASEAKYRSLFESIDEGFCVIEILFNDQGRPHDWIYLEVNPAFEQHTGLHDAAGRAVSELVPDLEDHWFEMYGRVVTTGEPVRFANEARGLNDRWIEVYAFRLGGAESRRVAVLFNDITQRRQAEAEREYLVGQLREADARKDEFLAMLAHELRNPLGAISGSIQLARLAPEPSVLAELPELIQPQVTHLTHLIDDLLDVSRITQQKIELRPTTVTLADVVVRAVALARPQIDEKQHRLTVDLPEQPVRFVADPTRVEQMLSNLLTNAAKYSDPQRAIHLLAAVDDNRREVVVRVRDEGHGIVAEMLPRIFDLFTQVDATIDRAQGGLGIGLTLVRSLAEMHGGSIIALSQGRGHGSEFELRLPIGQPSVVASAPTPSRLRLDPSGRVLIVDDNQVATRLTSRLLQRLGFEVAVAHDGLAGVERARSFHPTIILLDIGLPGMNGYEVARTLRDDDACRSAIIVAVSGYGEGEARRKSKEAGFDHHLVKPLDFDELMTLIGS